MAKGNSTRSRNGLTARQCTTLPPGKYNDSNGLWLAVSKSGSRKGFPRVTVDGKRRGMGLGALRDVSLRTDYHRGRAVHPVAYLSHPHRDGIVEQGRMQNILDFAAARQWRDHRVPLSMTALTVLEAVPRIEGNRTPASVR